MSVSVNIYVLQILVSETTIKELISVQGNVEKPDRWVEWAGGVDGRLTCREDHLPDSDQQHLEYVENNFNCLCRQDNQCND